MVATIVKNDRLVVLREVLDLMSPMVDEASQPVAENKGATRPSDLVVDRGAIEAFECSCPFFDVDNHEV